MKKLAVLLLAFVVMVSFSGLALAGEAKKEEKAAPRPLQRPRLLLPPPAKKAEKKAEKKAAEEG